MAVCSLIFMNVAFSITSIAFILPSAACDFQMTTVDKGRLSAAPMLGKYRLGHRGFAASFGASCRRKRAFPAKLRVAEGREFTTSVCFPDFLGGAVVFLCSRARISTVCQSDYLYPRTKLADAESSRWKPFLLTMSRPRREWTRKSALRAFV